MKLSDFGFTDGINEVIAITFGERVNTAPIGIIVENADSCKAFARLYRSHTRRNLERNGKLWVNVVYDPIVWTLSSFEDLEESWFESLNPPVIRKALAWCEFECRKVGEGNPAVFELKLVKGEVLRSYPKTVNRGFNALIEALVYATRYLATKNPKLLEKIEECGVLVRKCGGKSERKAFEIVLRRIR